MYWLVHKENSIVLSILSRFSFQVSSTARASDDLTSLTLNFSRQKFRANSPQLAQVLEVDPSRASGKSGSSIQVDIQQPKNQE